MKGEKEKDQKKQTRQQKRHASHVQTINAKGQVHLSKRVREGLNITPDEREVKIWIIEDHQGERVGVMKKGQINSAQRHSTEGIKGTLTKDYNLVVPANWRLALCWYPGTRVIVTEHQGLDRENTPYITIQDAYPPNEEKKKADNEDQTNRNREKMVNQVEAVIKQTARIRKNGIITVPLKCRETLQLKQTDRTNMTWDETDAQEGKPLTIEFYHQEPESDSQSKTGTTRAFTKGWKVRLAKEWIHQQELRTGRKVVVTGRKKTDAEGREQKTITIVPKEDKMTVYKTVRIPLMDDTLTPKKRRQLDKLTARDTTVIKRYVEIINKEEDKLWRGGREGQRLDTAKLDSLTLTSKPLTRKGKTTTGRETVPYPLQQEFDQKITTRELKECRNVATGMWHVYREQVEKHDQIRQKIAQNKKYRDDKDALTNALAWWERKRPHAPCQADRYEKKGKKLPRRANHGTTMFLHKRPTKLTPYWLEVYYPGAGKHVWLPLNLSGYHLEQLVQGPIQTLQLKKHDNGRWYAHMTIKTEITGEFDPEKSTAALSLDLGIKKTGVAVLLTEETNGTLKSHQIKIYVQKTKIRKINYLDNQIASLQRKVETYRKKGKKTKNLTRKLKRLSTTRHKLAVQYDHVMTAQVAQWVERLSRRYNVIVGVGKLTRVRQSRHKGDGKSRKHRSELHRWSFARITEMLRYKCRLIGLPEDRFVAVPESWTSKTCSRCGSTDTSRPFQALLVCHTCGAKLQADINGALNIAFRLIMSLDEDSLDHWLIKPLLDRDYPNKSAKESGRRNSRTKRKVVPLKETSSPSQTSRPTSGTARVPSAIFLTTTNTHDETPSSVNQLLSEGVGLEPASGNSDDCALAARQSSLIRSD
ncbi:MAG: RNA-guided endonuclease InsQ/TnpB family protein [Promethearchaeota archaeon]